MDIITIVSPVRGHSAEAYKNSFDTQFMQVGKRLKYVPFTGNTITSSPIALLFSPPFFFPLTKEI